MKEKNIAGVLAFFGGFLGIHRFYLGQVRWGIFYIIANLMFGMGFLLGLIDAIAFWSMDQEKFDYKYNPREYREIYGRYAPQQRHFDEDDRRRRVKNNVGREPVRKGRTEPRDYRKNTNQQSSYSKRHHPYKREQQNQLNKQKALPHIEQGKKLFKDYDYEGAILAFEQALKYDKYNYPVYFNLACAYSLVENVDKSLQNLDKAVELGFRDFEKIETHDAFSFLRVQQDYLDFKGNNYRLPQTRVQNDNIQAIGAEGKGDLLAQLNYLQDLRKRGLLSQAEFEKEKSKLSS